MEVYLILLQSICFNSLMLSAAQATALVKNNMQITGDVNMGLYLFDSRKVAMRGHDSITHLIGTVGDPER